MLTTASFWKATAERAVKTIAQAAIALIGTAAAGLLDVDWVGVASGAALAGVLSVLTSVASSGVGGVGPSLANEVTSPPAPPVTDERPRVTILPVDPPA